MAPLSYKPIILATVILQLFSWPAAKANSASDETLLRTVGMQLYLRKNWAGAEAVFHKLIEICPQDYFASEKLVKALLADDKAVEAVGIAKKLVIMQPKEPEACYLLGKSYEQVGNNKDALDNYKKAHALCDANLNYVLAMVSVYKKLGRDSDTVILLKDTLKNNQQSSLLWGQLFECAVAAKRIDIAHESLEKYCQLIKQESISEDQKKNIIAIGWRMIALDCWRASSYKDQMLLCFSLDDYMSASNLIEVAKTKFPDSPEVFNSFEKVISQGAKIDILKEDIKCWDRIKKSIRFILKQAEVQKFASG